MSAQKKSASPANPFLKKASGPKPPNRAALKTQQKHGGLGHVGRGLGGLDNLITPSVPAAAVPVPSVSAPVASVPAPAAAADLPETEKVLQVPPQDIERCPFQPRTEFRREELDDLVESIRENGVIQPLTCRRRADGKLEPKLVTEGVSDDSFTQLVGGEALEGKEAVVGYETPATLAMKDDTTNPFKPKFPQRGKNKGTAPEPKK